MKQNILLAVGVGLLFGSAASAQNVQKDAPIQTDFRTIGLAYHGYHAANQRGPSKAEDLAKFLQNDKRLLGFLKSGKITFIYGVGIDDMPAGTSATVIAHDRGIARTGGLALLGDGSVRKMTAEQFKKATIASPKKK
jgi:hypothetical protein